MSKKALQLLLLGLSAVAGILIVWKINSMTGFSVSRESGFYDEAFDLTINCPIGSAVYYTLDGSNPSESSMRYDGPIHISDASSNPNVYSARDDVSILFADTDMGAYEGFFPKAEVPSEPVDKCTVLRAICVNNKGEVTDEIANSYFVGFDKKSGYDGMEVVSIITDPDNLFDYETGIMVVGKAFDDAPQEYWDIAPANYKNKGIEWEREANVSFFDTNRKEMLSQKCGIRVQGGSGRALTVKSFNLYAREEYDGNTKFNYDFWGTSYFPDKITLASGSQDTKSMMRNKLVSDLSRGLNITSAHFVPCVVFIDGEYWGVRFITEKFDLNYFEDRFSVGKDNVMFMKNGVEGMLDETDTQRAWQLWTYYYETNDFTDESIYRQYCQDVDIDSILDYYATEIYIGRNHDWPQGNSAFWTTRAKADGYYSDNKWRAVLYDVYHGSTSDETLYEDTYAWAQERNGMFNSLCYNRDFQTRFVADIERIADTYFTADKVDKFIDEYEDLMREPMTLHFKRFYGDNLTEDDFIAECEQVRNFFHNRRDFIVEKVRSDEHVELVLNTVFDNAQ